MIASNMIDLRGSSKTCMRRLLIVSPSFPPANTPDMHRVRLSLPFYRQFGWEPSVLAVDAARVEGTQEPKLLDTIPGDVPIHRVTALPARWTRKLGFSALGLRAFPFLFREGARMIRQLRPDLVFFSTTMFFTLPLGRVWKRRFGVPFVIDLQDPWVGDYYDHKPSAVRPRKYRLAQRFHRILEPWTMKDVDGLVAVSENYHRVVRTRYPWIDEPACVTLPFGASAADFEVAAQGGVPNTLFDPADGLWHGVYAGVLGGVMRTTCLAICQALATGLRQYPELFARVRLHFVGTDYVSGAAARPTIRPMAERMGLGEKVFEQPQRIGFLDVLRVLKAADFLLLIGSDNPAYTASKVFPYILARRPLLAAFHEASSVVQIVNATEAGTVVPYGSNDSSEQIAARLLPAWRTLLEQLPFEPSTNWQAFEPYTAREMTRRQCEHFDLVLSKQERVQRRGPKPSVGRTRSKRVLIVSPHFPPTNAADMHRVRQSLPKYREFGWEPDILTVDPAYVEGDPEPELVDTVPSNVAVHRVRALRASWTRKLGFSALGIRAFPFLYWEGMRMIQQRRPDLVFFSTTMFPVMPLGRLWKRMFGVPFVLDMQDPWVHDDPNHRPAVEGKIKNRMARRMHKILEPWTMRSVDGLVSVSENYHDVLRQRYPWIRQSVCRTLPFAASEIDFQLARESAAPNTLFDPADGLCHGVYAGRLGGDMHSTCQAICQALAAGLEKRPELFRRVRLHFVGTDYAVGAAAKATMEPIARRMGLGHAIFEDPRRRPYLDVLRLLMAADFLLVVGSDDPSYTASKIFPYIMARKPLLAIFHQDSSVVEIVNSTGAGHVVTFDSTDVSDGIAGRVLPAWQTILARLPFQPETDWQAFEPYMDRQMTHRLCDLFDSVLAAAGCDGAANGAQLETV
jgi:hypothetical protein